MSRDFPEADWKILRELKPALLDRLCVRILDTCRVVIENEAGTPHQRYLMLFDAIQEQNEDLGRAFDGLRRSTAIQQMAWMRRLKLFEAGEWERFSPETREIVLFFSGEAKLQPDG